MSNPTWTTEKPTVAGWYWFAFGTHDEAEVVRVQEYACVPFGSVGLQMERMNCEPQGLLDGWWCGPLLELPIPRQAGPITPDSYQQGRVAGLREARDIVNAGDAKTGRGWLIGQRIKQLAQQAQGGVGDAEN